MPIQHELSHGIFFPRKVFLQARATRKGRLVSIRSGAFFLTCIFVGVRQIFTSSRRSIQWATSLRKLKIRRIAAKGKWCNPFASVSIQSGGGEVKGFRPLRFTEGGEGVKPEHPASRSGATGKMPGFTTRREGRYEETPKRSGVSQRGSTGSPTRARSGRKRPSDHAHALRIASLADEAHRERDEPPPRRVASAPLGVRRPPHIRARRRRTPPLVCPRGDAHSRRRARLRVPSRLLGWGRSVVLGFIHE